MNKDFNDLPDWDDRLDEPDEEGEEWKPNVTREACKALYQKWSTVITMLKGGLPAEVEDESHSSFYEAMMIGDAYEVAAKIRSSEAGAFM